MKKPNNVVNTEETDFIREDEKLYNPYRQPTNCFWLRPSRHPKRSTIFDHKDT